MGIALPAGWTQVPVVCGDGYSPLDEGDLTGDRRVVFISTAGVIKVAGRVVVPAKIVATVDADGQLEADFTLPATNDPDLSETGWGYTVHEKFNGGRAPFTIVVPYDALEVDLATVNDDEPNPVSTNPYLRESDIGVDVASQAAVVAAQAAADAAQAAADTAQGAADTHSARTDNPHAVTAVQVGAIPTAEKGAANGVATLGADSKVPAAQLPAIAITDVFVVNSEAAQLALVAEEGDVAKRTDFAPAKTYIHNGGVAGTLADWTEIENPDLAAHEAAPDPHPGYVLESSIDTAGSVAGLNADGALSVASKSRKRATLAIVAGAVAWDLSTGDDFVLTLTENATLGAPSNLPPIGYTREGHIVIKQDATGGRTLAAPAGTRWPNRLAPVVTTTAGAEDRWGYSVYNNAGTAEITLWPARDIGAP